MIVVVCIMNSNQSEYIFMYILDLAGRCQLTTTRHCAIKASSYTRPPNFAKFGGRVYDDGITIHENFHGKFSLCAEYLIRSICQKLTCRLKLFTDHSDECI